jgi:DNA-binding MarR family transcriptional regulator
MRSSPESESLDFLLAQICPLHHARAHTHLETLGLYRGQPPMLHALWEQDGLTHGELATHLHIQPATVTKMVQRMEKTGFVECKPDAQDQRVSRVYLTDAGRAIQAEVERVWHTMEDETFAGFTAEERVWMHRFFLHMRENLTRVTGNEVR